MNCRYSFSNNFFFQFFTAVFSLFAPVFAFLLRVSRKTIFALSILFPLVSLSQTHEYIFNNNLNALSAGPSLTEIFACGGSSGSYGTQTVGTTSGSCLTSNSFCFTDGAGLQYPNPGLITSSYTINVFFRFSSLGGYARVIDFSNSASDAGIYFLGNCLNLYPNGNVGTCPYFNTNTYYLITFVRDGSNGVISVYVDGTLFGTYNDSGNLYRPAGATNPINFFRDDNVASCEAQPGCVKYISVSPTIASASDVTQLWNNITTVIQATPVTPPTVTITAPGNLTCTANSVTLSASSTGNMVWNGGSLSNASNPASANSAGTYIVKATDSNGCTDTAMVTIISNTTPPVVSAGSSGDLSCSAASVNLTGTSSGSTMVWNGGALTNSANPATVNATGTYVVTATSISNGCTNTASVTVAYDASQSLVVNVNSPTVCSGQSTVLTATGATSYVWSTGATTSSITVSPTSPATYTVTGTTGSCSGTATASVTIATVPVITGSSATICAGQTAVLTAGGGTTYLWSTGATTNSISVSPASDASYTVTGTTSACSSTATSSVTVISLPIITSNSATICTGQSGILSASGGTTYLWTTGATSSSITVSPLTDVSYTVTGTTAGCSNSAIGSITVAQLPVITASSVTICAGDIGLLIASGGTSYSWNTGETTSSISVSPSADATYTVTGIMSGCSNTAVSAVVVKPIPAVIVNSPSMCVGGSSVLTAGGGTAYVWSTGATTNSISVSPSSDASYTVTSTTNGCSAAATSSVTVVTIPVVSVNSATICAGQTATLTASGGTTYIWSTGETGSSVAKSPLAPTSYTVTGTTSGCSNSAIATVAVNQLPVIVSNSVTICAGDTAQLTALGAISYSWNTGETTSTINVNPSDTTSYTVTGTVLGCSNTAVSAVIVNPLPVVSVNSTSICTGGSATLIATGANTYTWSTGATTNQINDSPIITTTYTVIGTTLGCNDIATATITINPFLSLNATGSASVCSGNAATIMANASNGSGTYTYAWAPSVTGTGSTVTVSSTVTTTYTVTVNDGCSPPAIDSVTIIILPAPVVSFSADNTTGCAPLCVNFTDNSNVTGGTIVTHNWNFGAEGAATQYCFTNPGQYSVTLTVTSNNGCASTFTSQNMITVSPYPFADFSAPLSTGALDPTVQFIDNSAGAATWTWDFGDSIAGGADNISNLQNPGHTYPGVGTYCVNLIVGNTNACYDTTQICLNIEPEFSFYIPNSFSPNDDGRNDEFYGRGDNLQTLKMQIYDRWGNLIFYTDEIDKYWNGKTLDSEEIVPFDTYAYIIHIIDNKNKPHKYIGIVTVSK